MIKQGAREGDTVVIGGSGEGLGADAVIFDFEPTISAGAELLHGRRGTDLRLDGR